MVVLLFGDNTCLADGKIMFRFLKIHRFIYLLEWQYSQSSANIISVHLLL